MSELDEYDGVTGRIPLDPTLNDIGAVYLASFDDGAFRYFAESLNGRLRYMVAEPPSSNQQDP